MKSFLQKIFSTLTKGCLRIISYVPVKSTNGPSSTFSSRSIFPSITISESAGTFASIVLHPDIFSLPFNNLLAIPYSLIPNSAGHAAAIRTAGCRPIAIPMSNVF